MNNNADYIVKQYIHRLWTAFSKVLPVVIDSRSFGDFYSIIYPYIKVEFSIHIYVYQNEYAM